jgi:(p)ppGpp synthase/HD superfamily hydrolase
VATILAKWSAPPDIVAVALLHDVFKLKYSHCPSLAAIEANFSLSIASLVWKVTRLGRFGPALTNKLFEEPLDGEGIALPKRLSVASAVLRQSPEAVVIKLADRLHNLESVDVLSEHREKEFARAILNIFAPFASRLGRGEAGATGSEFYNIRTCELCRAEAHVDYQKATVPKG